MLFHVTDTNTALDIWDSGNLKTDNELNRGRERRRAMRQRIDKHAELQYTSWVPRTDAVFAWASFDAALQYANQFREPAIIQFECDGDAWCVENFVVEDLYREYSDDISNDALEPLISRSEPWTGQRNDDLEVWMQPAAAGEITEITDTDGNPLSLD